MLTLQTLLLLTTFFSDVFSVPTQVPLRLKPRRKLQGRFLQITDIHPDPHYTYRTSLSSSCHRKKPKKETPRSGYYGTPFGDCDSPFTLSNFTLDFLDKHWASEIDFVIWTGDNARHDNDHKVPRTTSEIYDLNRAVAQKMEQVFLSRGISVIPSIGEFLPSPVFEKPQHNLDCCQVTMMSGLSITAHNIMTPGPNSVTNEFSSIWKSFIPFSSYQVFQRGAYYSVEVIPDAVAVIALNTMYFYDSNKAVGGCEYTDPDDPGNLEFDWLEVQLDIFRQRNMQVWLSGHVPPTPGNYFPECFVRYTELSLRFQDTILGHLFGHMNKDHFFFLEADDLQVYTSSQRHSSKSMRASLHDNLFDSLLADFETIRKKAHKLNHDNFTVINVSPSVVPNPYQPSFRIFSYNITNYDSGVLAQSKRKHGHHHGPPSDKDKQCKKAPQRDTWKCHLNAPWHSDPDAPARRNSLWSPLGYAQYYIPHLAKADKTHRPKVKLEYLTFAPHLLHPPNATGKGTKFHYPLPLKNLPRSLRNASVTRSKYTPYHLSDLTIPSWIGLARQLANSKERKLRKKFKKYMHVGG